MSKMPNIKSPVKIFDGRSGCPTSSADSEVEHKTETWPGIAIVMWRHTFAPVLSCKGVLSAACDATSFRVQLLEGRQNRFINGANSSKISKAAMLFVAAKSQTLEKRYEEHCKCSHLQQMGTTLNRKRITPLICFCWSFHLGCFRTMSYELSALLPEGKKKGWASS